MPRAFHETGIGGSASDMYPLRARLTAHFFGFSSSIVLLPLENSRSESRIPFTKERLGGVSVCPDVQRHFTWQERCNRPAIKHFRPRRPCFEWYEVKRNLRSPLDLPQWTRCLKTKAAYRNQTSSPSPHSPPPQAAANAAKGNQGDLACSVCVIKIVK